MFWFATAWEIITKIFFAEIVDNLRTITAVIVNLNR